MSNQKRRRYSLVLPETLFEQVNELAKGRQTTVVDIIRRFITLGLIAAQEDVTLLVKRGDEAEREVLLL